MTNPVDIRLGRKTIRTPAATAQRKSVLQRCVEINEELKRADELKRRLAQSIILDGVIDIDDCEEMYR